MNKIKQWILNRKFVVDAIFPSSFSITFEDAKRALYTKAFSDASKDLEETNMYNTEQKAKELSKTMLNDMLSVVDMNSIVTVDKMNKLVYIGGIKTDAMQLANLKAEAEFIVASSLWKLLYETPKELAQRSMFVSSETLADIQKGKSMLYTLSTQKNIIDTFRSYKSK